MHFRPACRLLALLLCSGIAVSAHAHGQEINI